MNRTGTTFLQKRVFPFLEGVNYIPLYLKNKYARNPFLQKVDNNKTLISNENFCFFTYYHDIDSDTKFYASGEEILYRLKKCFPNARIIFCTRNKDSWLRSVYNNLVKNGYAYDFEHFLEHVEYLDIDNFVKVLNELFDVFVYSFEDFVKDKKKVVSDICSFIGVSVPDDIDYSIINYSYSDSLVKKLVKWNSLFFSDLNPDGFIKMPNSFMIFFRKIFSSMARINKK